MGQSLVKNYIHIVFSTKHRTCLIEEHFEQDLFIYIAGIVKSLDCLIIKIGGCADHIHILCELSKKIALMNLIRQIKGASSRWINETLETQERFEWQHGYGTFSVRPNDVDLVIDYISKQKEHHSEKTFKEEYLMFLNKYKIDYDERYLWD